MRIYKLIEHYHKLICKEKTVTQHFQTKIEH